ncbi:MAG: SpoIIE family protein phosphatase [Desulfobacterales bacterium]|nr:SpoIIE family protein phosphatase [Desulfobacterales bacterium]
MHEYGELTMLNWILDYGNDQHKGTRKEQQDYFASFNPDPSERLVETDKGFLAVVADGMGGHAGGGNASVIAVTTFVEEYKKKQRSESIPDALNRALLKANAAVVHANMDAGEDGEMGTTLVACVLHLNRLFWVSVGDSRLFLYQNREIKGINEEHSYGADLDMKVKADQISQDQADAEAKKRNMLTSYLGLDRIPKIDCRDEPIVLKPHEKVLICTDGLINALDETEIAMWLEADKSAQEKCEILTQQALKKQRPRQDNITTILMELKPKVVRPEVTKKKPKKKDPKIKKLALAGVLFLAVIVCITALFIFFPVKPQEEYTITASSGKNGSIEPSGNVAVNEGASQTFKITPYKRYEVDDVQADGISVKSDGTYTFESVSADHKIHVTFKLIEYKVTARSEGQGKIYPDGTFTLNEGDDKSFIMEAYEGYEVRDVKVDNSSVGVCSIYTIPKINANHEIIVYFKNIHSKPPSKPKLKLPENKKKNIPLTPIFKTGSFVDSDTDDTHSWSKLEISTKDDFFDVTTLTKTAPDDCTSFKVSSKLNAGTKYYWRVKYVDNRATVSEWSKIYSFTTMKDIGPYDVIDPSCDNITWEDVQKLLASLGLYSYEKVDGVHGPDTKKAIKEFQEYYNLDQTSRLDRKTCTKLKELDAE